MPDGTSEPSVRLGNAMRAAREDKSISVRSMAERLGYRSHTTLIEYEKGRQIPTDEVVEAYEKVLNLRRGHLQKLLDDVRIAAHGDAFPKRRRRVPMLYDDGRRWLPAWTVVGAALMGLVTGGVLTYLLVPSEVLVADGTDPKVTGCDLDAITSDQVEVYFPAQYRLGTLELRRSPRCGTTWGRFLQVDGLPPTLRLHVTITARRDADSAASPFGIEFTNENVYGNQLLSRYQCVYVEMQVSEAGRTSPVVRTTCVN